MKPISSTIIELSGIGPDGRAQAEAELPSAEEYNAAFEGPAMTSAPPAQPAAPSGNTPKPTVILPGGGVTITDAARQLYDIIAPKHRLFMRGKVVVALHKSITGALVLDPVRPSAARSLFEKYGRFFAWRSGVNGEPVLKPSNVAEETARAFLDCHVAEAVLPRVNGLVNCPVLIETESGLKVCGRGYNAESGLLILKGGTPDTVPLPDAVNALKGLLADFRFQTPSDASRAMAAFITPALKMGNLIHGHVPADVAEADQSQSGKTYRQKMIAAIYGESPALVPLKRDGVGGTDESLFEKLVNGRPFIQFDNYRGLLDSPALEAFLTADDSYPCRIPHCREIEVDPSRYFILMTSNGVETTRDLANRSSIVRIFKRPGVQFPDTLGNVKDRQPYFLGCVFAIVREWRRQGKPRTADVQHDFREWAQPLDWIVQNVCGMAPLMDGHVAAQERVSDPVLTFLRRLAIEAEKQDLLGTPLTASQLFELASGAGVHVPGLRADDAQDEEKARKVIGGKLAGVFKERNPVQCDSFAVHRDEITRQRDEGHGGEYMVKTYTFQKWVGVS